MARHREREIAASLQILHPGIEHRFLGQRSGACHLDGSLHAEPSSGPVDELAAILDEVAPRRC